MNYENILSQQNDSEIFIGFVGAIGIDLDNIHNIIQQRLKAFKYSTEHIKISRDVIGEIFEDHPKTTDEFERIEFFMNRGNDLKQHFTGTLALAASSKISEKKIVASLKIEQLILLIH